MSYYGKKKQSRAKLYLTLTVIAVILFVFLKDRSAPQITATPNQGRLNAEGIITVEATDGGSGITSIVWELRQENATVFTDSIRFEKAAPSHQFPLTIREYNLNDGPFELIIRATDNSLFHWGKGNTVELPFFFAYDTTRPIVILSGTKPAIQRGGSAFLVFESSEDLKEATLAVGDFQFTVFQITDTRYATMLSWPVQLDSITPTIHLVDVAGNTNEQQFVLNLLNKKPRKSTIPIDDSFLTEKRGEYLSILNQPEDQSISGISLFKQVNNDIRKENRQFLQTLAKQGVPEKQWQGKFLRQNGTATLGYFADYRTYKYKGKEIDKQFHLGADLASVANMEINASNSGTVLFAGYLGIYGNCVVIDHGMNIQTLYGHMSSLSVKAGDLVKREAVLGRSGSTGQSAGDHLHFAVLVGGVPVNPVEWWDGAWVKRLETAYTDARLEAKQ